MMNDADILQGFEKLFLKLTEINSMMKRGEFIIAYEKLGGVQKVLAALIGELQRKQPNNETKP